MLPVCILLLVVALAGLLVTSWRHRARVLASPAPLPPVLLLSICDGRWGRYSVPRSGAAIAARLRRNALDYPIAKVIVNSELDIPTFRNYERYKSFWSMNFMDAGHIQKHLFLLEHRDVIRSWPGIVLYQDCKNGHLGYAKNTARLLEILTYLDEAQGMLVANQNCKHRHYCPKDCWTAMGRDAASPAYETECQIRAAWILFKPHLLPVLEAVVAVLENGPEACKTNGEALYQGREAGRGDQTVLHNLLFARGMGKQLSAYDRAGTFMNSPVFFDYTNPDWRLALEEAACA
jgi:hypothetical protein